MIWGTSGTAEVYTSAGPDAPEFLICNATVVIWGTSGTAEVNSSAEPDAPIFLISNVIRGTSGTAEVYNSAAPEASSCGTSHSPVRAGATSAINMAPMLATCTDEPNFPESHASEQCSRRRWSNR